MNALWRLRPYIGRYKARLLWGLVAITVSNVFSVAIPRFVGQTFDGLSHGMTPGQLTNEALIILGLSLGSGIFLFLTRQTIIVMSRLVERDLRNDFMSHVQALPMGYFTTTPTGDVMALATNDISAVREFVGPALMYTANTVTTFSFALVMMLILSWKITLLALVPLPFASFTVYYLGKKINSLFGQVQGQFGDLTSRAQENISGVRVVRAYVRETYSLSSFAAMSQLYKVKNMKLVKAQAMMMPAMMALIGLSQIAVLLLGGYEVIHHRATVGDIAQFFAYLSQLIWPVIAVGWVTNLVQRGAASMARLNKVMDVPVEAVDRSMVDESISAIQGKIEFRAVNFRYRPELPDVLHDITFTVEPGTTLAIIGTTGSGKSTIVDLIARLYDVDNGELLIDGHPIKQLPLEVLRSSIGVVTQETFLFSDTIAGNIRFGRPDASMEEAVEASKIAQLYENVEGFPNKFDTIVGERGLTLSGGQKQRTSIARAVLRSPRILVFDDALSAVDTETEERILSRLRDVMRERTSILIAHRISTVKDADQIIVMDGGRITERGTHEELIAIRGEYARMYELQLLEEELASL